MNKSQIRWSCLVLSLVMLFGSVTYLVTGTRAETDENEVGAQSIVWGNAMLAEVSGTDASCTAGDANVAWKVYQSGAGSSATALHELTVTGANRPADDLDFVFIVDVNAGELYEKALVSIAAYIEKLGKLAGASGASSATVVFIDSSSETSGTDMTDAAAAVTINSDANSTAILNVLIGAAPADGELDSPDPEAVVSALTVPAGRKLCVVPVVYSNDGNDWFAEGDFSDIASVIVWDTVVLNGTHTAVTAQSEVASALASVGGTKLGAVKNITVTGLDYDHPLAVVDGSFSSVLKIDGAVISQPTDSGTDADAAAVVTRFGTYEYTVSYRLGADADYIPSGTDLPEKVMLPAMPLVTINSDSNRASIPAAADAPYASVVRSGIMLSKDCALVASESGGNIVTAPIDLAAPGSKLLYTVTAENIGNTDLSGLTVTESGMYHKYASGLTVSFTDVAPANYNADSSNNTLTFDSAYTLAPSGKVIISYFFTVPDTITEFADGLAYKFESTSTASSAETGTATVSHVLGMSTSGAQTSDSDLSSTDTPTSSSTTTTTTTTTTTKTTTTTTTTTRNPSTSTTTTTTKPTTTASSGKGAKTDDNGAGYIIAVSLIVVSGAMLCASSYAIIKDHRARKLAKAKRG